MKSTPKTKKESKDALPSIFQSKSLKEDVKKYEAHAEAKNVEFPKCKHKQAGYDRDKGEIRCSCGAAWTGPRLGELYDALTKEDK